MSTSATQVNLYQKFLLKQIRNSCVPQNAEGKCILHYKKRLKETNKKHLAEKDSKNTQVNE